MSQNATAIPNTGTLTGLQLVNDANAAIDTLITHFSGASAPASPVAYQLWADTTTGLLKLRNGANSAWVTIGDMTAANLGLALLASPTFTGTLTAAALTASGTITGQGLLDLSGASAGQIKFPATQNASANANTLDDYEEGTWTGAFTSGGGSITINTSFRTGKYVKVGGAVSISGDFRVSSVSSPTGHLALTGLPFASFNAGGNTAGVAISPGTLASSATTQIIASIAQNNVQVDFYKIAAGTVAEMAGDVVTSSSFWISATYFIV